MNVELEEMRRHITNLPDAELLGVVTTHQAEYRQVARDLAAKELMRRGISFELPPTREPLSNSFNQPTFSVLPEQEKQSKAGWEYWVTLLLVGLLCFWVAFQFEEYLHLRVQNRVLIWLINTLITLLVLYGGDRLIEWLKAKKKAAAQIRTHQEFK